MTYCLLNQAHSLRINFGGVPQHSNNRIPRDANRVLSRAYHELSDVSSYIIKILLIFFYTGYVFLGGLFFLAVGTQIELKPPLHCFCWCLNGGKHTAGRTVKD